MSENTDLYLIWSNQHRAWWRHKSAGYTTKVSSAGRYSHEEAIKICAGAHGGWNKDIPPEIPVRLDDAAACYVLTPRHPAMDWELSEKTKEHLAEIDRHIVRT